MSVNKATISSDKSNVSRLHRYFDTESSSVTAGCRHRAPPPHANTSIARSVQPPKTNHNNDGPINSSSSTSNTIDGAACKTSTWTYKHVSAKNGAVAIIEKGARVRAEKKTRKPLQRLNWREGPWPKGFSPSRDYLDLDIRPPSNPASSEVSPRLAVKRISLLASHQQYKDAANFIHRLPSVTVRSVLPDLPMDTLVESMPLSLPLIEALYCTSGESSLDILRVDRVVWQMVRFFAQQEECLTGDIRWEFCGPFVVLCRDVLKIVARIHPTLRKSLVQRRRQLERAIEGMGHHGLVGTSDESLTSLNEALKLEFEKVVRSYTSALRTLEELSAETKGNVSRGPAPIQASHQRQLSISPHDIQERLIKNKSLLNIVEPTLGNHSLDILLGILQRRIEHDKDALFQFTQLRKESKDVEADAIVAPILMRYAHGCDQVLDMMKEVMMEETGCDVIPDDDDGSDVSGYHSDSDSAIMMSGNSPYVTKHARFNFLTRSVRERSKVGVRMKLPMPGGSTAPPPSTEAASIVSSSRMSSSSSDTQSHRGTQEDKREGGHETLQTGAPSTVGASPVPGATTTAAGGASPEVSSHEIETLRDELARARHTIRIMHEREKELKDRLNERNTSTIIVRKSSADPRNTSLNGVKSVNLTANSLQKPINTSAGNLIAPGGHNNPATSNEKSSCRTSTHCTSNTLLKDTRSRSKSVANLTEDWHGSYSGSNCREYPKGFTTTITSAGGTTAASSHPPSGGLYSKQKLLAQEYESKLPRLRRTSDGVTGQTSALDMSTSHATGGSGTCRRGVVSSSSANSTPMTGSIDVVDGRIRTLVKGPCIKTNNIHDDVAALNRTTVIAVSSDMDGGAVGNFVSRYGCLYAQWRVETLDALDQLIEMRNASELKSKLVFSVVVLAFRSVTASATALRDDVRRILGMEPSGVAKTDTVKSGGAQDTTLDDAMTSVITANVEHHDLSSNVEDVCQQIWATLYDYPGLKNSEGLLRYIKECVRVAWGLVNMTPPYSIEYEARTYRKDLHVRFHTSVPENDTVRSYIWPALIEGPAGPCVHKGVVVT